MRVTHKLAFWLVLLIPIIGLSQTDSPRMIGPVVLIDGDKSITMKYSMSSMRGTQRNLGVFSQSKIYLTIGGGKADLRIHNTNPSFEFTVDPNFNVGTGVYIFRFDGHKDRRDVRVGMAQVGKSKSGVPEDHIVPTTLEEISKGETVRYRMKPTKSLKAGEEYCLVRSGYSCFDFGVDP